MLPRKRTRSLPTEIRVCPETTKLVMFQLFLLTIVPQNDNVCTCSNKPDLLRGLGDIFLLKSDICPSPRPATPCKILHSTVRSFVRLSHRPVPLEILFVREFRCPYQKNIDCNSLISLKCSAIEISICKIPKRLSRSNTIFCRLTSFSWISYILCHKMFASMPTGISMFSMR